MGGEEELGGGRARDKRHLREGVGTTAEWSPGTGPLDHLLDRSWTASDRVGESVGWC